MDALWVVLALLIIFIGKGIYDSRMNFQSLIFRLEKNWGNPPEKEYTSEQLRSIGFYYRSIKEENDIDDITWNDLDMDDIYFLMNNTVSAVGEEYLYAVLRKLKFDNKTLEERNRIAAFFKENPKVAHKLQLELSRLGKLQKISVFQYINLFYDVRKDSTLLHYGMAIGLVLSICLIPISPTVGGILTFVFVCNNVLRYYKRKGEIEPYITVCSYIVRMLNSIEGISKLKIEEIKDYTDRLIALERKLKNFKKGSRYLAPNSGSGDLADIILDYVRMLFHVDLIKFNGMLATLDKNKESLNETFELLGTLDSMIAVASFRTMIPYYSLPDLIKLEPIGSDFITNKKNVLEVKDLYHPLIEEPVSNSIAVEQCALVTGSNASGKSTFLKSIAINTILSQTIYTSLSRGYRANYYYVASSMALRDDLFNQESYYIVEIKSLKRILDRVNSKTPVLCFVDEVLRGTNTLERIAASSQILHSFAGSNAICFAATHDIELTHILENYYGNYHFKEEIVDGDIQFDYKLHEGRATSKNAIQLLGMIGYSDSIINKANMFANSFLESGVWDVIS